VRGLVVDVHAGGGSAVRLELDDDLVERIQPFDPATQRSSGEPLDQLQLLPLEPFPAEPERLLELAHVLEGEHPALAEKVRAGVGRSLWWGALHLTEAARSWPELCERVVVCDRDEVLGELGRWLKVQERSARC
jgi:transcription-repair coupling factor (superfamily II helicase)